MFTGKSLGITLHLLYNFSNSICEDEVKSPYYKWVTMKKKNEFIKGFLQKINDDDSIAYAYQLTYGLLLAIFPFLIFVMTLIAYLGLDASYILNLMETSFPEDIYELVSGPVVDLVLNQRGGLLSASVFAAVYTASGGFRAFMKGMNKSMGFKDHRGFIYKYAVSIFWVILLALTILLALVGIVFGKQILHLIVSYFPNFPADGLIEVLRVIIPVVLLFGILSLLYMFIPAKNIRFKYAFPGAVFSTLLWITVTFLFQFYINNYANYSRFYGTLGALIGLLLWLSLTSIIMILGSSLNSYLIQVKNAKNPFIGRKSKKGKGYDISQDEEKVVGDHGKKESIPERKFVTLKKHVKKTMDASKEETDQ